MNFMLFIDKTYSTDNAKAWSKSIADDINRNLNQVTQRYKHVVNVVITQKLGQGNFYKHKFIKSNKIIARL
jgi:hypothetical protein